MDVYVYILYSASLDRFYVGILKHLARRLKQHLRGRSKWTARAHDWQHVFHTTVDSYTIAREMEKKIKAAGVKDFLRNLPASQSRQEAGQG